ncbi:hypothetical protein ACX40Y_00385 [Sphingomonas sp. RS6]
MFTLVKYGNREHIKRFFEDGTIQIGTVRSYDEETFGTRIGDDSEGISRQIITDNNIREYLQAGYSDPGWFGPGCSGNLVYSTNVCHNYAIFCLSKILHRDLCRDFDASYDAALLITEPFVFFHLLTDAFSKAKLTEGVEFRHVQSVQYRGRDIGAHEYVQEEFLKDVRYSHQGEVRASWMVGSPSQKFYRFKAPWARWACLALSIDDMPNYPPGTDISEISRQFTDACLIAREKNPLPDW